MNRARQNPIPREAFVAVLGVVLVAFNMRTAVAGLSPIYDIINSDVPLGLDARALLGALPPLSFVLGGLITPRLTRSVGLEWNLVALVGLMVIGHVVRSLSTSWVQIVIGSAFVLVGSGMGNVSLPPVIKRYFPHHIGPMSSTYIAFVSISSVIPPLIAVPLSLGTSWRFALGFWVLVALPAAIPWLVEIRRGRHSIDLNSDSAAPRLRLWKSPTAWAIAVSLSVSSITGYGSFAWLPSIAKEAAGLDHAGGGVMLALFAGAGLPLAFAVPLLAARMRSVASLVFVGAALTAVGALGLSYLPTVAPYLWSFIYGSGPLLFPLALVLINLRTESSEASLQLSAFAQLVAYSAAATGASLMGAARAATGDWHLALDGVALLSLAAVWAGLVLARNHTVEQELTRG